MGEPHRKPSRRSQPISRHPLFPAIVALWFAALLSLGSFVLRPALLEALVLDSHVDLLIPAAAPPLGMTARLALALMLGALGGVVGWALAKRAAGPQARPAPQVLRMADVDFDDPFPWPSALETPAPASQEDDEGGPVFAPSIETGRHEFAGELPAACEQAGSIEAETILTAPTAAQRIATAELDSLSHVELVERLAIALQRRQERLAASRPEAAEARELTDPVVRFPGFADRLNTRQNARQVPPSPAPMPAPQETEKALREALATLQRMSGGA